MTSIDSEPSIDSEAMSQQRPIKSRRGRDYAFSMPMQGFTAMKQKHWTVVRCCKGKENQAYLIRWVEERGEMETQGGPMATVFASDMVD